jgi:hypothetical protein
VARENEATKVKQVGSAPRSERERVDGKWTQRFVERLVMHDMHRHLKMENRVLISARVPPGGWSRTASSCDRIAQPSDMDRYYCSFPLGDLLSNNVG